MAKHHHQSKAEQIYNKAHGAAQFHDEKSPNENGKFTKSENKYDKTTRNNDSRLQSSNKK